MGKIVFNLVKGRKKIVDLFIFRFIKIPPGADSNNLKRKIIFSPFEGNSQHFMRPCMRQVKKQPFKVKFWNWGSMKIWHNLPSGRFFAMGQFITCRWVGSWGLTKGEAGLVSSQYSQSYSFTSPAGVCVWRKQSINVIIPPFRPNYWIRPPAERKGASIGLLENIFFSRLWDIKNTHCYAREVKHQPSSVWQACCRSGSSQINIILPYPDPTP